MALDADHERGTLSARAAAPRHCTGVPAVADKSRPGRYRGRRRARQAGDGGNASRELASEGLSIRKGGWLGLAEGSPVAGGESFDEVAREVAERLLSRPRGILTLLTGEEPQPLDALLAGLALRHPELELEVHDGGQPHYPLLLAAE